MWGWEGKNWNSVFLPTGSAFLTYYYSWERREELGGPVRLFQGSWQRSGGCASSFSQIWIWIRTHSGRREERGASVCLTDKCFIQIMKTDQEWVRNVPAWIGVQVVLLKTIGRNHLFRRGLGPEARDLRVFRKHHWPWHQFGFLLNEKKEFQIVDFRFYIYHISRGFDLLMGGFRSFLTMLLQHTVIPSYTVW